MDTATIESVVSEYVTLRRAGANLKGLCPFHDDKTPSFMVSPSKGICKCFACGEGGNAVQFVMKIEQVGYVEALKILGKKYGIEIEEKELSAEDRNKLNEREAMFAVNEWASNYFHDILKNDIDGRTIGLAYFRNRGFRDDIIEKFRLGFSLDKWDALYKEAIRKGYQEEYLTKTGLCFKKETGQVTDKYRGRVMFPWFNVSGKIVAFGGRVLDSRTKGVIQKYINSSESQIYSKSRELYGLYQAKRQINKEDRVFMVEGYTDVLSMHQCGIENVVANSGTALTEPQIRLLHRFTNNITLLYDGDEAGIHAALRGTDMLLAEGMNVKILLLPDGDDPDSFARKHNAAEFKAYVEEHQTDFIIFKTNLLLADAGRDPLKKAKLTQDIVYSISVIPEEIVRTSYIHECSELLHIEESVLLRQTQKDRAAAFERIKKEKEQAALREQYLEQRERAKQENNAYLTPEEQADLPPLQGTGTQGNVPQTNSSSSRFSSPEEEEAFYAMHGGEPPFPPAEVPTQPSTTIQDALSKDDEHLIGIEKMIMTLVVRHGEKIIEQQDEEGNVIQVPLAHIVYDELANDEIQFRSQLYKDMLNECIIHVDEEGFNASRFFRNHPNQAFSTEAVNLITERYQLSIGQQMQSEEELAPDYITHMLLDYKFAIIESNLRKCQTMLTDKTILADPQRSRDVLQDYMALSDIKRELAKALGERVFIR